MNIIGRADARSDGEDSGIIGTTAGSPCPWRSRGVMLPHEASSPSECIGAALFMCLTPV